MSPIFAVNPHKILTRLVALSVVFDILAVVIWSALPWTQWTIYQLDFLIVGSEAAIAAIMFAITLYGLNKKQKWAPKLAITISITQRIFGTYVFFPSPAILLTLAWSLTIIYFAYKTLNKHP